ncbi:MAG: ATP-binding cassette domain-containing protein, partial [Actinomycetota bacterium]
MAAAGAAAAGAGASAAIEVDGLSRRFGELTAVDNISFTVERGEIFGFLGPNGAGKT